jgi:hypothetical protein
MGETSQKFTISICYDCQMTTKNFLETRQLENAQGKNSRNPILHIAKLFSAIFSIYTLLAALVFLVLVGIDDIFTTHTHPQPIIDFSAYGFDRYFFGVLQVISIANIVSCGFVVLWDKNKARSPMLGYPRWSAVMLAVSLFIFVLITYGQGIG